MKTAWKLAAVTVFAVAAPGFSACAAPTAEEADNSGGAATEGVDSHAENEKGASYADTAFLGGAAIKQWIVRGDTAESAEVAKLWISMDGAFTVSFPTAKPWNGSFKADKSASGNMSLRIINAGGDDEAATSPVTGAWSFKETVPGTIALSRAGSTTIVITAR